jgi:hypothetical protein
MGNCSGNSHERDEAERQQRTDQHLHDNAICVVSASGCPISGWRTKKVSPAIEGVSFGQVGSVVDSDNAEAEQDERE